MKKILMIGYCNQFFRKEYAKNLKDDCIFDIISFEKGNLESKLLYNKIYKCDGFFGGIVKTIFTYIQFAVCLARIEYYDAIHIHSVKKIEAFYAKILKRKCKKMICTIYGSDFYRVSDKQRDKLAKLFEQSDCITIETEKAIEDFNIYYKNKFAEKIVKVCFGIASLNEIEKLQSKKNGIIDARKEFEIPIDSFVITVGYNAIKEQHHIEIIDEIKSIEKKLPRNYFVIIPLGYGDNVYRDKVIEYFSNSKLNGRTLTDFYPTEKIAKLRVSSNVMIQLQDTDLISCSMLEYLFADNHIITGAWLPYKEIEEYIFQINHISDLSEKLLSVIDEGKGIINRRKQNSYKDFLKRNYMWQNVRKLWYELY